MLEIKTSIRVSDENIKKLDELKLTAGESYENILIRLLDLYEPLFTDD